MRNSKVVPSYLAAWYTHSLESDQVMHDGGAAIVLLHPVDFETVATVVQLDYYFWGTGLPYTG